MRGAVGTYALALDGDKRPCRVRTSNAGHCLFTRHRRAGARARARRRDAARRATRSPAGASAPSRPTRGALQPDVLPQRLGLAARQRADRAPGFARYGLQDEALRQSSTGLFDASVCFDLHRLPELFCGFARRPGEGPTLYPVACSPQAWASAAVFALLQACLGLDIRGTERRVVFSNPRMPDFLGEIYISGLRVADGSVDLALTRHGEDVGVNVVRREGHVGVMVVR